VSIKHEFIYIIFFLLKTKTKQQMKTITDLRILKAIGKRYNLDFCSIYKYYIGDVYEDNKGVSLPNKFNYKNKVYELKYFSGCFNPYLIECEVSK